MEDVKVFFKETEKVFTIYVVEQRFVVGRGAEYFRSFKGKENYIDTNKTMKKRLTRILQAIHKKIPDSAELIKDCFNMVSPLGVLDVITSLSKLFTVQEHQAAGPDVIDPIIIQEGDISPKYLNQIIELHKMSFLRPTIIILLKDNDFERAKQLLSGCPHNTNVKLIRNSGETELYKVINCGADNPDAFLEAFSHHCFSSCSCTSRNVLYNEEWAENSITKLYGPSILKIRTDFLYQDKTLSRNDLNILINQIENADAYSSNEQKLLQAFLCTLKLYRVFCNDGGKEDIATAYRIAQEIGNDILLAQVYRSAYFLEGFTFEQKLDLLDTAYNIFDINGMEDNAIYCKNNRLVRAFDTENIKIRDFLSLQEKAINNVPGLVGMSHVLNNVGVAHLVSGYPDEAITYFNKGLDYAYRPERYLQRIALLCNRLIAKTYCFMQVDTNELWTIMNLIFDNREILNLPFISARYALNIITIALSKSRDLGKELLNKYPVRELITRAFKDNVLGSGQILLQLSIIETRYNIQIIEGQNIPRTYMEPTGIKKNFLAKTGYNPFVFSIWF